MRGHGATIVGPSLKLAVFRAVYTEVNARLQTQALGLGEVKYLTAREAVTAAATNAKVVDRAWNLWVSEAEEGT